MTLPHIETERLLLRPRTLDDLESCLAMDRDPEVTKFVDGPWDEPDEHRAFILERMRSDYPDGLGYWTVTKLRQPDCFLGWILLLPYHWFENEVEIGWRFAKANWGQGYATEAAASALDHAVYSLGLNKIVADIHPENFASQKVAEKIGLIPVDNRQIDGMNMVSYQMPHSV
ncbi:GNAT family N-acetyltransferase [Aestuariispira insulae]|uniref:RimJ/RimL family protein N-acetyltransferase n=1 Tax=Aestuariispira insulae TaxID=1461337 RepID=A0A3D9HSP2_9PROT|nr:GNAT family N-acetyltransferase [Aestuariispira insulae]RED52528.1 RimJ/RimL family protein N-acetyltransferase [Aestuariispira insulae]